MACCTADDVGVPGCDFEECDGAVGLAELGRDVAARVLRVGRFTLKLDILPQTKFQLREEKPFAKKEAAE